MITRVTPPVARQARVGDEKLLSTAVSFEMSINVKRSDVGRVRRRGVIRVQARPVDMFYSASRTTDALAR
jgi:hypothetical protein